MLECTSDSDGSNNNNLDDENCDTLPLIHATGKYATPTPLKFHDKADGREQIARIFRNADTDIQNVTSALRYVDAGGRLVLHSREVGVGNSNDSALTLLGFKITLRTVIIVGVAGPLLLVIGLLVRQFIV